MRRPLHVTVGRSQKCLKDRWLSDRGSDGGVAFRICGARTDQ